MIPLSLKDPAGNVVARLKSARFVSDSKMYWCELGEHNWPPGLGALLSKYDTLVQDMSFNSARSVGSEIDAYRLAAEFEDVTVRVITGLHLSDEALTFCLEGDCTSERNTPTPP